MSIEEVLGDQFKPEVRTSGKKLVAQEKISISSHSDTEIHAYARVAPPAKVKLKADDVASTSFIASCSCPTAQKSRFCKHIWGTILLVQDQYPDFLIGKNEINQAAVDSDNEEKVEVVSQKPKNDYQENAKKRASEYRKEQYQKQKARVKDQKRERRGLEKTSSSAYPPEIEAALHYFSENGFPMPDGPSRETITEAKRKLSRFFHPDRGGSHEESVVLNQNCEILMNFLS